MPSYPNFSFTITARDPGSRARLGRLVTPHGAIDTPNFIFCGTKASIKALSPDQVREARTDIILANTYHLMLQPGADIVAAAGGLHGFMGWDGPMLTDSGGFQVFSMSHGGVADEIKGRASNTKRNKTLLKITEEGAHFRSYLDGRKILLTPELSIDLQRKLGADLIVMFDELTASQDDRRYTERSMRLTHRWGDRCLAEFERGDDGRQALYGIVQGGIWPELRREAAEYTASRPFFATAVGGCLGTSKAQMYDVVAMAAEHIHPERPVHLLGIGDFDDIFRGVRLGMDTFDCVSPTRIGRHGWARARGVPGGRLNIRNARFRDDTAPLDESCGCYGCGKFSRSYLHHLIKAGEMFGQQLLSIHNIYTQNRLMREIRAGLAAGTLDAVEKEWLPA